MLESISTLPPLIPQRINAVEPCFVSNQSGRPQGALKCPTNGFALVHHSTDRLPLLLGRARSPILTLQLPEGAGKAQLAGLEPFTPSRRNFRRGCW
jgi:hypothetical protein